MDKNKKVLKFDLSSENIEIRSLLSQQFLNVRIRAISNINPNRNNSHFTTESMYNALPTFKGKPILCNYNVYNDKIGAHDSAGFRWDQDTEIMYEDFNTQDSEIPVGVILDDNAAEIVVEDGLTWIYVDAVLWIAYNYKLIKKLIRDKGSKISVEVEVLDSYEDENGVEVIRTFELLGISIIGQDYTEAIPTASMTILDLQKSEKFTKQINKIKFAYDNLNLQKPDFKNPVENETPIEEITFDKDKIVKKESESKDNIDKNINKNIDDNIDNKEKFEEGEVKPMTYQAKMDIVRIALKEVLKWVWFYITDIDDEFVYYVTEDNDVTFKVPYGIEEGGAFVDMDKREKVVRSWQTYSEDMDKNKKDFDVLVPGDVEANAKAHIVHDDEKAGIDLKMAENKEECAEENKEECATQDECKMSVEDKEECAKEECGHPDNKGGDSSGDGKKSGKETEDCDCDDEHDEHREHHAAEDKEECAKEDCAKEDCSKEECANPDDKNADSSGDGKKEVEQSTVQQPPIISQDTYSKKDYDELMCKFTALEKEHNILMAEYKNKVQTEQLNFAQNLINSEKELNTESAKNIFSLIENEIKAEKFSDCESVEKFTTQQIATTLYMDKKNQEKNSESQKSSKNDFSYNIQKNVNSSTFHGSADDVDALKKANEKLKYL